MNERRDEREEQTSKILEPHQLDPSLMRHACIAAVGYLAGASIQNKEQIIATLREAVTTPCAGWETFNSLRAKLADLEQQLARNQQFCADLQKAIAERDASLVECRPRISRNVNSDRREYEMYPTDERCKRDWEESDSLLNRIDALLGAKGET